VKKNISIVILTLMVSVIVLCASGRNHTNGDGNGGQKLASGQDSVSYIIGRDVGSQIQELGAEVDIEAFALGVREALDNAESRIDSLSADSIRRDLAMQMQEHMAQQQLEEAKAGQREGEAFLRANSKKKGVRTTESGLQYTIIERGTGAMPRMGDSVQIQYVGMLLDSTVFDSTLPGEEAVFELERIIPGLAEGIMLMQEGARYRFFVPSELAYGVTGAPPVVPPNATLIFDVELQEVIGGRGIPPQSGLWAR
jgi:FKBP-type peptidyl-prolyl cis-trans isomerase